MKLSFPLVSTGLWLLGLICSFTWVQEFQSEFFIGTLVFLFSAMAVNDASGIERREWRFPISPVLIAGGLFWLVAGVSLAASDIVFTSWIYFFFLSILPLSVVFFLVGHGSDKRLELAYSGIVFLLSLLSLYALCQYFFLPKFLHDGRVHEPLVDPNGLAAVFSIGIFLSAGQVLKNKTRFGLVSFFLLICGLFTTGSRGAFLALAIAGIIFVALAGVRHIGWKRIWLIGIVTILAFIAVGLIYAPLSYSGPWKVLLYTFNLDFKDVFNERGLIWQSSWQILKAHPWFGIGPGNFQYYYPEVRQIGDMTAGLMVHNDPLQFAVEMGVLSPVLFYTTCVLALARTLKAFKNSAQGDDRRLEILIPLCALIAFVLHAHISFNFYVLPGLLLAGFCFALWHQASGKILEEKPQIVSAPVFLNDFALKALFMSVAILMVFMIALPLYSQKLVVSARENLESGDLQSFAEKLDRANALSLGKNADVFIQAAGIPLGILSQKEIPISATDKEDFVKQADSLLKRAEEANPRDADIYMLRSQLAKAKGNDVAQKEMLEKSVLLNPAQMAARLALAEYLEQQGKLKEAVKLMNDGIDVKYAPEDAIRYMDFFIRAKAMEAKLDEREK